jgi:hypothetical protein
MLFVCGEFVKTNLLRAVHGLMFQWGFVVFRMRERGAWIDTINENIGGCDVRDVCAELYDVSIHFP